jgi:DNA-binding SARP family transcriptional activator
VVFEDATGMSVSGKNGAELGLRLFGPPALLTPEGERMFAAALPFQLLSMLAVRRARVSRDELAENLWPGRGQSAALSNLRTALARAQRLPDVAGLECLLMRGLLRWPRFICD